MRNRAAEAAPQAALSGSILKPPALPGDTYSEMSTQDELRRHLGEVFRKLALRRTES